MTSEVAIANAYAVALAADSAVTIGDRKIYNSALKLFSLSKVAPVGVMIYGNAGLLDVPWETLIKEYRKKLGGKLFPNCRNYGSDFIEFLNNAGSIFAPSTQENWIRTSTIGYFVLIRDELENDIHPILSENGKISVQELQSLFSSGLQRHLERLKALPFADGFDHGFQKSIRRKYTKLIASSLQTVFEKFPMLSAHKLALSEIAAMVNTRQVFSSGASGVVIAGYGEEEIYPTIIAYDIEGVIENRIKHRLNVDKSHSITSGSECQMVAFAQDDMVATFMNGLNPDMLAFLHSYLSQMFQRLPELLDGESISDKDRQLFGQRARNLLSGFVESLRTHIQNEHAHPVLNMVTVLPKDELAAMAEALVNLTAFKRRMTAAMETVGGPIDVAVISKGDGLIWVKRKHYFPAGLNQHFFSNYFRGIANE